jgi:hypothetical protein
MKDWCENWCENCIHFDKAISVEPCYSCKINDDNTMTNFVVKSCDNCLHSKGDEVCYSCRPCEEDNWELATDGAKKIPEETVEETPKEAVDHPAHYQGKYECIDEMRVLFGDEAVKGFCMCNAYKYRYRAGKKQGEEYEKDIAKAEWYMDYLMTMEREKNVMRLF